MEKKTYTIKVKCTNCGQYTSNIEIEKGVRVYKELQSRECPVCGCRELVMVENELTWTTTNSTDDMVSTGSYTPDYDNATYLQGKHIEAHKEYLSKLKDNK
jgi:rRNA maturation protein Nop10